MNDPEILEEAPSNEAEEEEELPSDVIEEVKAAPLDAATLSKKRLDLQQKLEELLEKSRALYASMSTGKISKKKVVSKKKGRLSEEEEDKILQTELAAEDEEETVVVRLTEQPPNIRNGQMKPYQLEGLNWMIRLYENNVNGILADEMGLGKTLQSISLLAYLRQYRDVTGPHLVIAPKSTLGNWLREFKRWCPDIKAFRLQGNQQERNELIQQYIKTQDFDVCVTSYEIAIREKAALRKLPWHYLVVDEAHRLKNECSVLAVTLRTFSTAHRLLLTGTPLQNNLHELWALLNFLLPQLFDSAEEFDSLFTVDSGATEAETEILTKLHKILRPFLLRRLKTEVAGDLPPKQEILLYVGLSEVQKQVYRSILQKDFDALNGSCKEGTRLLNIVMQLRKAANHPYLFEGVEDRSLPSYGEHLVDNAGKLVVMDKLLPKLQTQGSRCLLFSQMTRVLDIIEDYCTYRGYRFCRIDGSTDSETRDKYLEDFNAPNSDIFIFLLSTRAGGLGLNLATADTVIIYDSDWNPQMDLQAQDRAHRIGQKKPVNVYRFVTEGTIEEKIVEKASLKLRLDAIVIQQGRIAQNSKNPSKDEMIEMIRYGADAVFRSKDSSISDEDIDLILARGAAKTAELNEKFNRMANRGAFSISGSELDEEFEKKQKDMDFLNAMGEAIGKRKKNQVVYDQNQYYRDIFATAAGNPKSHVPRPKKCPNLWDFQFFNKERITELFQKEWSFFEQYSTTKPPEGQTRGITEEEAKERDQLLEEGFSDWNRRDYNSYCRALEAFGKDNTDQICASVAGKTPEQVLKYHTVFWQRIDELADKEKILRSLQKSKAKAEKNQAAIQLLDQVIQPLQDPFQQLTIKYSAQNKGKGGFTHEEDVFLLVETQRCGYGEWDKVRQAIYKYPAFRFDYLLKSRSAAELGRRVDVLVRNLQKNSDEKSAAPKRRGKKTDAAQNDGDSMDAAPTAAAAANDSKKRKEAESASSSEAPGKKRRGPKSE